MNLSHARAALPSFLLAPMAWIARRAWGSGWLVGGLLLSLCAPAAAEPLQYNRDIRPILSSHCFACHGPDSAGRKADLRLDLREAAVESGAVVPQQSSESELVARILSADPELVMPPPHAKKPLDDRQKQLLQRWIDEGAAYQRHWSFIAPVRPALPPVPAGSPWASWPVNEIDRFTLARMLAAGLAPSPEAKREILVRRVSFDLTGLPPRLEDLQRFAADESPRWYEQMVDYYLGQSAFGERMALAWMDASRYGDTSVFHADGPRDMWPWRDWVIDAYNRNLPFDQFTIEQIAGDLLPDATPQQKIASGFNRNHATTDEGGAIAEEWRVDYVVDRVKTTSNVWLGISMECGQCHEHKFDPISQKEYYGFFAFFNQTTDPGMQTRNGNQAPVVDVPNPRRDAQISALRERTAHLQQQVSARRETPEFTAAFQKWLSQASAEARQGDAAGPPAGLSAHFPLDETEGDTVANTVAAEAAGKLHGKPIWETGKYRGALRLDGSNYVEVHQAGDFERTDAVSYGCWVKPQGVPNGVPIGKMNEGNAHRGWDLYVANGQVAVHLIHAWPDNAIKVTTKAALPRDKWTHVMATYDGSGRAAGVKIYFDGKPQPWDVNQDSLSGTMKTKVPLKLGGRASSAPWKGALDEVQLFRRALTEQEVAALAGSDPIAPLLAAAQRTPEQVDTLKQYYAGKFDQPHQQLTRELAEVSQEIGRLEKVKVTSMIMGEQEQPRPTYLLMRGHYASPDTSEVIEPGVPSILPPLPEAAPRNRLGLARWLVSDQHPLTARVTVNRYWTQLFGRGIVATPMDFGSQGAWPSHPQLLDWLAVDFREHGWDIKRTLKQILMSATYRQSSRATAAQLERDPQNELLSRGARFRLQGEMIRDMALSVSGLLVDQVGGPGVKPYQPPGLWNEVSLSGNVRFVKDQGDKLYRKSMYIYWKRSSPHPGMRIFDAPTRETCVVARPRTNTPLQALYTLNGEQFVEAARHLAERMIAHDPAPENRVSHGYQLVTAQLPGESAVNALLALYQDELKRYRADPEAAAKLLAVGDSPPPANKELWPEHAAWSVVANVLLNLDAALTKF